MRFLWIVLMIISIFFLVSSHKIKLLKDDQSWGQLNRQLEMILKSRENKQIVIFLHAYSNEEEAKDRFKIPVLRYNQIDNDCQSDSRFGYSDFRCAKVVNTYLILADNPNNLTQNVNKTSELKSWNRNALFLLVLPMVNYSEEKKLVEFFVPYLQIFMFHLIFLKKTTYKSVDIRSKNQTLGTNCYNKKDIGITTKIKEPNWMVQTVISQNCGKKIHIIKLKNISQIIEDTEITNAYENILNISKSNQDIKKYCSLTLTTDPSTKTGMRYFLTDMSHLINISFVFDKKIKTDGALIPVLQRPFEQSLHYIGVTQALLYTPLVGHMEPWETVTVILSLHFWVLSIFSFTSVAVCWWAIRNLDDDEDSERVTISEVLIYIFALKIGLPIPQKFLAINFKYRVLFITWIIYCMHFVVIFQGRYCKLLVNPPRKQQITSFEGVKQAKLELYVWDAFIEAVQEFTSEFTVFYYTNRYNFWNRLYHSNKLAGVLGGHNFINAIFPNTTILPPYLMNSRSYVTYFNTIGVDFKQHVLIKYINTYIARLNAAGYEKKIQQLTVKLTFTTEQFDSDSEPFSLELRHFAVPAVILATGIVFATVFLIFELKKVPNCKFLKM